MEEVEGINDTESRNKHRQGMIGWAGRGFRLDGWKARERVEHQKSERCELNREQETQF